MEIDWSNLWDSTLAFLKNSGVNILWAGVTLLIGTIVAKLLLKLIKRRFDHSKMDKIAKSFILSVIKFALFVIVWLFVLRTLGVDITGLVAMLAAAGVAIGLALQDTISSLANGIIIIATKPFKEGDYVSIGGTEGIVVEIKMLHTKLRTFDNKIIILPNKSVINNTLTNFDTQKLRRVDLKFDVSYESDEQLVKKVILNLAKANGKVLLEPAPLVNISAFGDSNITFLVRVWTYNHYYWDVYFYLMDNVYNEFKKNNISISYNQVEVRMRTDEVTWPVDATPLPERQEIAKETNEDDEFDFKMPKFDLKNKTLRRKKLQFLERQKRTQQNRLNRIDEEIEKLTVQENADSSSAQEPKKKKNKKEKRLKKNKELVEQIENVEAKEIDSQDSQSE